MGATESKVQGNGAVAGEGVSSKAKLTLAQGTQPLQTTSLNILRDGFYGKRPVSVFTYDPSQFVLDNNQGFLPKAIKKLKTIRHPSVLRFIDCKTSSSAVHLITEQVVPLTLDYLKDISEDEILVGLFDIMVALHFLHSQCHVSHNNVQLSSIFVSNGRWVLGGMEFTGTVTELTETGLISLLPEELIPPEYQEQSAKMASQERDFIHSVDIWQYGKLIETLIQDGFLHTKSNALPLDSMLDSNPRKRPTGDTILESNLFTLNNAVSIVRYCRLKGLDKAQNAEWSQMIMPKLHMLPPSIMEKIVLPQLLTQEFFAAEGFDKLYRSLFTPQPPQPLITEEVYRAQVMPFMIKLWTYRQADIRLTILRLFEVYLKAVVLGEGGSEVLGQIILPEILAGLQDADPKVYFASLCGLATAIPYVLLVTTLVDTDLSKQKFSVKSLYEQTLIPQIMAFWISEDCVQESKVQLIEVVMGMWCSIYTLGLHNHAAVKDMSATLTLTLVSVLKLLPANERVELISKSFTKHCTNGLFCISGLLKFLPQFLLDEDVRVREAAAKAISEIAFQTINLMPQTEITEQQDQQQQREEDDSSTASISSVSSPSPSQSTHVSRIRQYCEMQQLLLPPRRPIFSRSTFAGDRSASSNSLRNFSGSSNSAPDLQSSRRSSIVSQDSFMFSDQGSLKTTPSLFTPSLTRAGSFSGDTSSRDAPAIAINGLGSGLEIRADSNLDKQTKSLDNRLGENGAREPSQPIPKSDMMSEKEEEKHIMNEDLQAAADQLELMKALETAKAEMKIRQLPVVERQGDSKVNANATRKTDQLRSSDNTQASAAFKWDDAGDGENDDWDNEDLTTLAASSRHSPSPSSEYLVEDEATRLKREKERAEKQEQLRLKRDQKQQEMQAKREARRQQMAEKQGQKKSPSNGLKLSAVRATPVSVPSAPAAVVAPKPVSGHSMIHLSQGADIDDKDNWDVDEGLNMGDLDKQLNDAEADELFKDLEVSYKPAYVGLGSTAGHVGINGNNTANISGSTSFQSLSTSSSTTLLKSPVTISTAKTLHSSFTTTNMTSVTTTTTTAASTGSASLGIDNSQSRETSPTSTPKRAPSPLLKPTSNSNSNLNNNSNIKTIASPTINSTKTSSLAPQMDEAALEEADDWENAWS